LRPGDVAAPREAEEDEPGDKQRQRARFRRRDDGHGVPSNDKRPPRTGSLSKVNGSLIEAAADVRLARPLTPALIV
jgi:hypothetical protein